MQAGINYSQAQEILHKYIKDQKNIWHCRETEVIMRALAKRLGEDEELWAIAGLLHDIDWESINNDTEQHGIKMQEIFEEDGECVGQQYQTDTGPIDIFDVSKDKKTLLVIELKKGKASDVVVGQTLRYMGYVKEQLAEADQIVKGIIIALEDDQRIRRALVMVPDIEFFRYQVSFKLVKA